MNMIAHSNNVAIDGIVIRIDEQGRYCLNDLHKASGNEGKDRPSIWLDNKQTADLISEIEKAGNPAFESKQQVGTFVVKELVYAYAMWINAAFHLKVIRTFDAVVTGKIKPALALPNFTDPAEAAIAWAAEFKAKQFAQVQIVQLEAENQTMKIDVKALEQISKAGGSLCITDAAKALGMGQKDLHKWLSANNWIFKRHGNSHWLGYSDKEKSGYLEHKVDEIPLADGGTKIREQVRITPKGLAKLAKIFAKGEAA